MSKPKGVGQFYFGRVGQNLIGIDTAARRKLWVAQVSVADFLVGNGLVYQTSDVQYITARSNRWASPLEQQLPQTLVANLSAALPGTLVSTQPIGGDGDQLAVTITGFHGRYDGRAVVQGRGGY